MVFNIVINSFFVLECMVPVVENFFYHVFTSVVGILVFPMSKEQSFGFLIL
jgi:hypothetical protein